MNPVPVQRVERYQGVVRAVHKDTYIPALEPNMPDHRLIWFSASQPLLRRGWVALLTLDEEGNVAKEHFISSTCDSMQDFTDLLQEIVENGFDKYKYITYDYTKRLP